jgi:hypothetical protein
MGKQSKPAHRPQQHQHQHQRHGPRGVTKAKPVSALAAAVMTARRSATDHRRNEAASSSSMAMLSARLIQETETSDGNAEELAPQLVELCRECVSEAGGKVALSVLGGLVRDKASRRGLQTSLEGAPRQLNKLIKTTWGGWEGFVHAHADAGLVIINGCLQCRALDVRMPANTNELTPMEQHRPIANQHGINQLSLSLEQSLASF